MSTPSVNTYKCAYCQCQHIQMCLRSVSTHAHLPTVSVDTYKCAYCHCRHIHMCLLSVSTHTHVSTVGFDIYTCAYYHFRHTHTSAYCQFRHIHICLLSVSTHTHGDYCQFRHIHICLLSVSTHTDVRMLRRMSMVNRNLPFKMYFMGECKMRTHLQSHNVSVHINTQLITTDQHTFRLAQKTGIKNIFRISKSVSHKFVQQCIRVNQLQLYYIYYTAHFAKPSKYLGFIYLDLSDHMLTFPLSLNEGTSEAARR